ncbi:MAG: hypothetical protein KDK36_15320, partial [Leptospiraceae bacterium]|nr:hypothetical protein [Leptospiraceae bacterium]
MRFSFYYFLIVLVSIFNCASIERKTLEGRGLIDQTEIRGFKQFKIYTSRNYLGYIQAEKNPDSFDKKLWRGKVKEDSVKQTIILSYSTNRIAEVNPQLNEFLGAGGSYENVRELKLTLINPVIYVLEDISIEPAFSDKKEFFNNPYIGSVLKVDKIKIEFVDKNGFTLSASAALGIDSLNISSKIKKEDKEDYFYFAENAFVGYKLFPAPKDPEKYVTPEENKFRVVIFPFEVNSPDSKDEKYKHGLSEATSYAMNRISNYLVIARNEYQKVLEEQKLAGNENYDQKSAVSIGKIMSANTLVLGKLDRDGKKARIRCTLVDVQTGTVLEKGTLKQDVDVENKTLAQIADEWEDFVYSYLGQPTVRPKKSDSIIGTNSDKAWEYFVQGREKFLLMDEESLEKGVELFKKSIEEDPKFEEPHSYLAEAYIRLEYINQLYLGTKESFEDSKQKSFTHATRAIELQPDS